MDWPVSWWGQWICFCEYVNGHLVLQKGEGIFWLYRKVSFLNTLLYITQSINTYIDPVCPDRLTLRYCSCNTYLLHRRAELKGAPGNTWLMRNCTLVNNEPLAVLTYICMYVYIYIYIYVCVCVCVCVYICSHILFCLKRAKTFDLWLQLQIILYYGHYLNFFYTIHLQSVIV